MEAYQARIQALMASGMHQEARALALLVSERFPAAQGRVAPFIRQSEVASGNFEPLLIELSTATPTQRRELEATLTRTLHDPAVWPIPLPCQPIIHSSARPSPCETSSPR